MARTLGLTFAACVALPLLVTGSGVADDGYAKAMAACRVAAAKALGPTDFKCDWKAVEAGAPGAALTGRYGYVEKGLSGTMTILEAAEGPTLVGIETVSKDPNSHTCSMIVEAKRSEDDVLVSKPSEAEGCEIAIKSSDKPDIVTVTAGDACRTYFCGMRAGFDGAWKLGK